MFIIIYQVEGGQPTVEAKADDRLLVVNNFVKAWSANPDYAPWAEEVGEALETGTYHHDMEDSWYVLEV